MKRPLAVAGFTMLGTLFVFSEINSNRAIGAALVAALIAFVICAFVKPLRKRTALLLGLLVVVSSLSMLWCENRFYRKTDETLNAAQCVVTGTLSSLPYSEYGSYYYVIDTDYVNSQKLHLTVRIRTVEPIDLEPSDIITVSGKLYRLGSDDDSYLKYYKSKAMLYGVSVYESNSVNVLKGADFSLNGLMLRLRQSVIDAVLSVCDSDAGGVICALLLGEKRSLSERTQKAFQICGVSHLFAVSGLHLSLWAMFVYEALKKLRFGVKRSSSAAIVFCLFFMLLTGFNAPVVRAGFMIILLFSGNLFSREADSINSIGLALVIMLCINPYSAMSVSLWLSVLATMGIILVAVPINARTTERLYKVKNKRIRSLASQLLSAATVTLSVTVFTLPVYVFVFGNISVLTLAANLMLVSIGALCMEMSGIAAALILLRLGFVGRPLMTVAALPAKALVWAVSFMSRFPYALINVNSLISKIIVISGVFILALLFATKLIKKRKLTRAVAATLVSIFLIANTVVYIISFNTLCIGISPASSGIGVTVKYHGRSAVISSSLEGFDSFSLLNCANSMAVSAPDYYITPDTHDDTLATSRIAEALFIRHTVCGKASELGLSSLPATLKLAETVVINADSEKAQITFYQTKIVILFQNGIIEDNKDADLIIDSSYAASLDEAELVSVTRDGAVHHGGFD